MNHLSPTIVLTGGGSGGHITPILSLAHELKKVDPGCQLVYIGHKGDKFDSLKQSSELFDFTAYVNGGKFRRYYGESLLAHLFDVKTILLNARDIFRVFGATAKSLKILRRIKPHVVFSKGGFVVVPVCLAARMLRIPVVTHDSDAVPGLANRIVGRWAVVRAVGIPKGNDSRSLESVVYTGIPIDSHIKKVDSAAEAGFKRELGLPVDSSVLLVGGAGNGSSKLNNLAVAIAPDLLGSFDKLQILHLTGLKHQAEMERRYEAGLSEEAADRVSVLGLVPDFYKYSGAADVIISRAGATVLAEFAAQAKACVIIPSPFLAAGHQLKNAEELSRHQAAVVLSEEIKSDELTGIIGELLGDPARRTELGDNFHKLAVPDAAERLANLILRVAHGERPTTN